MDFTINNTENLTGTQKASIILAFLGPQTASEILKNLSEPEIEEITSEISYLEKISPNIRDTVLAEFHQMYLAKQYMTQGGLDFASQMLEKALGTNKSSAIINRVQGGSRRQPFAFLKYIDPELLVTLIQNEHPQTISLILASLDPDMSASILNTLPYTQQSEIASRIAQINKVSPDIILQIENTLKEKVSSLSTQGKSNYGGLKSVAEILNRVDRNTEKRILSELEQKKPELATDIKKLMFIFEDLNLVDDKSIQRILKETDTKDLAIALKGASQQIKEKIFHNMSERAAAMIKEDMEFMGPVRIRDVDNSQQKIVAIVRKLEETEEIVVPGRGREEKMVE
ncbi:MAG: flagellar motor switch protein FliG [Candidatus Firestonebacteria bacterium]|nr:flagellar motor switch protein FliG [Candidatus Firestonebacteria bacterium]